MAHSSRDRNERKTVSFQSCYATKGTRPSHRLIERLESAHAKAFNQLIRSVAPIQGAAHLLNLLKRRSIEFAIATSGSAGQTKALLARIQGRAACPVVTADDVAQAKPSPDPVRTGRR
jgi:beta-phosphoglucomutase-like phosphatase (HAD superfamily)